MDFTFHHINQYVVCKTNHLMTVTCVVLEETKVSEVKSNSI